MSAIQILTEILSGGKGSYNMPGAAPAAGGAGAPPIMELLQQSGLMPPPIDKKAEMRKAISRGLAGLSSGLASSKGDFLEALATGVSQGAGEFVGAREQTDKTTQDRARDLMKDIFGFAKAEDLSENRANSLEARIAAQNDRLDLQERLGLARLAQGDTRLEQGDRRLDISEEQGGRRLEQGDTRLEQGQNRIDETKRHNQTVEKISQDRLAETSTNNEERLKIQKDRAALDTQKLEAELAGKELTAENIETTILSRLEKMKADKAKELGLSDPLNKIIDPAGWDAKVQEYQTYKAELDQRIKSIGSKRNKGASSATQPEAATQPQVKYDEKNPARPKNKAEYDALPPGTIFWNPKTKSLRRKPANGQAP